MPPDSHSDFDLHLVQSVRGLRDLRKDLAAGRVAVVCLVVSISNLFVSSTHLHALKAFL